MFTCTRIPPFTDVGRQKLHNVIYSLVTKGSQSHSHYNYSKVQKLIRLEDHSASPSGLNSAVNSCFGKQHEVGIHDFKMAEGPPAKSISKKADISNLKFGKGRPRNFKRRQHQKVSKPTSSSEGARFTSAPQSTLYHASDNNQINMEEPNKSMPQALEAKSISLKEIHLNAEDSGLEKLCCMEMTQSDINLQMPTRSSVSLLRSNIESQSHLDRDVEFTATSRNPSLVNCPNYFLALRIKSSEIHKNVKKLQEAILNADPIYKSFMISVPTLHVTLLVLYLRSEIEVQRAVKCLLGCHSQVLELGKLYNTKNVLSFDGLDTFNGQVLFAKPETSEMTAYVSEIVALLRKCFKENDLEFVKDRFHPHLTIMKLIKNRKLSRKKRLKRIPFELYAPYKHTRFGLEVVDEILLCSMTAKKDQHGFYKVIASISLNGVHETTNFGIVGQVEKYVGLDNTLMREKFNAADATEWDIVSLSEVQDVDFKAQHIREQSKGVASNIKSCAIL